MAGFGGSGKVGACFRMKSSKIVSSSRMSLNVSRTGFEKPNFGGFNREASSYGNGQCRIHHNPNDVPREEWRCGMRS